MDEGRTDQLVFFAFDLLFLNGESTAQLPLIQRKERLQRLFKKDLPGLRYSEHVVSDGPGFRAQACKLGLEGASQSAPTGRTPRATAESGEVQVPQPRGVRGCRMDRSGGQPIAHRRAAAWLLTEDGRLRYAGRAGTGTTGKELKRLAGCLSRCGGEDAARRAAAA